MTDFIYEPIVNNLSGSCRPYWHLPGERFADCGRFGAFVAKTLSDGGVFNITWAESASLLWGAEKMYSAIRFVIQDNQIKTAVSLLEATGLQPCPVGTACPQNVFRSFCPAVHFHIGDTGDTPISVRLYEQSEHLWELPPLSTLSANPHAAIVPTDLNCPSRDYSSPALPPSWNESTGAHVPLPRWLLRWYILQQIRHEDDILTHAWWGILQSNLFELHKVGRLDLNDIDPELTTWAQFLRGDFEADPRDLWKIVKERLGDNAKNGPEEFRRKWAEVLNTT